MSGKSNTAQVGGDGRPPASTYWTCTRAGCRNCDNPENPKFKRCSRCKAAIYCSEECHKRDWASHKSNCNVTPDRATYQRLLNDFVSTPYLEDALQLLVIYTFGLHRLTQEELQVAKSRPLGLAVFLQCEPTNIKDFLDLFNISSLTDQRPMQGMPQIVAVSKISDEGMKPDTVAMWKQAIEMELADSPGEDPPPIAVARFLMFGGEGLVFTGKNKDYCCNNITITMPIPKGPMEYARHRRLPQEIPTGIPNPRSFLVISMNVNYIVQYINGLIRRDDENKMNLRVQLSAPDKQFISLASTDLPAYAKLPVGLFRQQIPRDKLDDSASVLLSPTIIACRDLIKKKVAREGVYCLAAAHYGYECEGIPKATSFYNNTTDPPDVPEVWPEMLARTRF